MKYLTTGGRIRPNDKGAGIECQEKGSREMF